MSGANNKTNAHTRTRTPVRAHDRAHARVRVHTRASARARADRFVEFMFVFPTLLLICVFVLYPFIMGAIYSFTDWNNTPVKHWVGISNYARLFKDITFQAAIKNTLMYGLVTPLLQIPLGLLFASILNSKILKLRGILRTAIYLPVTLSLLIVANIFLVILSYESFADQVWMLLGNAKGLNVMASIPLARRAMIIIMLWQGLGTCVVFMLAGLQGIPEEINEAAMVDGANAVKRFFRITLPMMRPTIMIVTFITMTGMLKTFDLPVKLTQGGPGTATISVAQLIFRQAFQFNTAGYATTTGIILIITVSALAYIQMRITGGREDVV